MHTSALHPLGTRANILLSSVFGPYAQDDAFGSRKINPMETLPEPGHPISRDRFRCGCFTALSG
jgi:hypothetical protein